MEKINKLVSILLVTFFIVGCSSSQSKDTLYVLNWGDYINNELVEEFKEEYKVDVVLSEVESNEAMYEQIKTNRTSFDIAFPSDYMIEQLDQEKLLKPIEFDQLKNYDKDMFSKLSQKYGPDSKKYVPYFNGTIGIMYSKKNIKDIDKLIEKHGWAVLFDDSLIPGAKRGMYNSSRDAFAAALFHLGYSANTTNEKELNKAFELLKSNTYDIYGDDNLKKNIVTGNLDFSLVYTGDFFEELFVAVDEDREIDFDFYTPSTTNYWVDGIVIPKDSKNTELAHKFIDFVLEKENAFENASYIGYASPINEVMKKIKKDEDYAKVVTHRFYDPATIKGLKPESFKFLGLDHMVKLEELFVKSKTK